MTTSTAASPGAQVDLSDLGPFIAGREHELFRIIREHDPLHWNDEPNGPGFWSLTRYADLITVIDDPATYVNGQGTQIPSRRVEGHTPTGPLAHQPVPRLQTASGEGGARMRVSIDRNLCVAHGQCEYNDPDHFTINDDGVLELEENPPDSAQADVLRAVSACPVRALSAQT